MSEERTIIRPDSPVDGPTDGVMVKTECIRTDFMENPSENEAAFQQREKGECSITASVEIGVFSIRDRVSGVMLTVALKDAMTVMATAIEASKEAGTWQNTSEQVASADIADETLHS